MTRFALSLAFDALRAVTRAVTRARQLVPDRALASSLPSDLRVVHIDNWFGPRWRHFAGKVLGALGTRSCERLVVPPFAQGRVLSEQASTCTTDDWVRVPLQRPLHIRQHSQD